MDLAKVMEVPIETVLPIVGILIALVTLVWRLVLHIQANSILKLQQVSETYKDVAWAFELSNDLPISEDAQELQRLALSISMLLSPKKTGAKEIVSILEARAELNQSIAKIRVLRKSEQK